MARYPGQRRDQPAAGRSRRPRWSGSGATTATGRCSIDETDGVGMEFEDWRFNLRMSNTEPLIRLNVESRGDEALMRRKTEEILALLA